jgi:tetratricopeptide (TPR) repeat protein
MDLIIKYENKEVEFNELEILEILRKKEGRGSTRVYSFIKILENYPEIISSNLAFRYYFMMAENFYIANMFEDAIEYYLMASKYSPHYEDDQNIGDIYNYIGQIYKRIGKYDKSLDYHNLATEYYREIDDWDSYIGVCLNMITVYHALKQFNIEESFLKKIESLLDKHTVSLQTQAMFLSTYGLFLKKQNQLNEAEICFRKIIDIPEDYNNKLVFTVNAIGNLASTLFHADKIEEANDLIKRGIKLSEENNLIEKQSFFHVLTAEHLISAEKYQEAVNSLLKAKDLSLIKLNKRYLLHIYKNLAFCNIELSNTDQAAFYLSEFSKLQEELFSEGAKTKIAEVEKEFSLYKERKEKELYQLKNVELVDSMTKLEESYKSLEDSQEKIIELERKNATLAAAVTANHEINQPLMIIQGEVELLKMKLEDELDSSLIKRFERIGNSINRISAILDKLTNVTEIEYKDYSEQTKMLDLD